MVSRVVPLWTSASVERATGGKSSAPWSCEGISIDTRTLKEGDLFIPLKGEKSNGHAYLEEARKKGAVAAFVSEASESPLPKLYVGDTLKALESLGVEARNRCSALRIGVTGSVGKTSTKEMLKSVFGVQGATHGNIASYNNQWGVPLTLARMPEDTEFGVFELGMSHVGEIRSLTQMVRPQISIITTIEPAHTEFFSSLEEIARAKAEIFEGMDKGSFVLLNQDIPQFDLLSTLAKERGLFIKGFGRKGEYRLLAHTFNAGKSLVTAEIGGKEVSYTLPVAGMHWIMNSLAVLGGVDLAGADVRKAAETLSAFTPLLGRGGEIPGNFTILDESYNANPASMRAALEVLGRSQANRKIAVLGDMRELGKDSERYHVELLEPLIKNGIDVVYCCGEHMQSLFFALPEEKRGKYTPTSSELIPFLKEDINFGDIVSVKGSLGTKMKIIVEALKEIQQKP